MTRSSLRPGFTLIEILLVLAIVSIVLATALPNVRAAGTRQRVDRAALVVASDLRSAFTSAGRARMPIRVAVPGAVSRYAVVNRVTGDTIVQRDFSGDKVIITALSGAGMTMDIYPTGVSTGADTITVKTDSYERRVTVSRVGFVRLIPLP